MGIVESLKKRRTYYNINKNLPIEEERVVDLIKELTELVPDAFNMKSARVVIALHQNQDKLWDTIYNAFDGKVSKEKIESFKSGAGTILYFYDRDVVENLQNQYPAYAGNFHGWAIQANAMLQISTWTALRELNIGASLQHYNPVIDKPVKELFNIPESYTLVAQMPFGGIEKEPDKKAGEDISKRVEILS